jgi:hypothetical protein
MRHNKAKTQHPRQQEFDETSTKDRCNVCERFRSGRLTLRRRL